MATQEQFERAKALLSQATRSELQDHAFGDAEVTWELDGAMVGEGLFGSEYYGMSVTLNGEDVPFSGKQARELRLLGKRGLIERNDSTGPEEYQEGACMPKLTREYVRQELVGRDDPIARILKEVL